MNEEDAIKCKKPKDISLKKPVKRRHVESPFEVNPKKSAKIMAASTEDEVCDRHDHGIILDDTIEVVFDGVVVQSPVMVPVLTRCASTPQDGQTLLNYVSPPTNNALLADSGFGSSVELSSGSLSDRSTSSGQARVSFDFTSFFMH